MNRKQLCEYVDTCPDEQFEQLAGIASAQLRGLAKLIAHFAEPEPQPQPKLPKVRKQRAVKVAAVAPEPIDGPAPGTGATVGLEGAVRRMLAKLPPRTYSLAAIAREVGADRTDVAVVLRTQQKDGSAVCTGHGRGALWCAARTAAPSSPRAVVVPAAVATDDAGDPPAEGFGS